MNLFFILHSILKCNILSLNHLKKVKFSSKMKLITELGEKHCLQYQMSHYDLVIENYLMMSISNLQKEIPMV